MNSTAYHFQDFGKSNPAALKQIRKCNILVIGNTGVGKITLIGTVIQIPISNSLTEKISKEPYTNSFLPIALYDTPGLEKENKQRKQVKQQINQLIHQQKQKEPHQHIHCVWYCLNSQVTRESDIDQKWISSLAKELPIILVITRAYSSKKDPFQRKLETNLDARHIVRVLVQPEETDRGIVKSHGLDTLKNKTEELLDEVAQKAILDKVNLLEQRAFAWCRDACGKLFGCQVVPIPLVKTVGSSFVQTRMIANISKSFGYQFDQDFITSLYAVGTGLSVFSGFDSFIEQVFNYLPVNQDNIQTIQDSLESLATIIQQTTDFIPFKDELLNMINDLAGSSLGNLPIIKGVTAIATIFSTWILGCALIEALKDYKTAEYQGQELPSLEDLLQEKVESILEAIKNSLETPFNPAFGN